MPRTAIRPIELISLYIPVIRKNMGTSRMIHTLPIAVSLIRNPIRRPIGNYSQIVFSKRVVFVFTAYAGVCEGEKSGSQQLIWLEVEDGAIPYRNILTDRNLPSENGRLPAVPFSTKESHRRLKDPISRCRLTAERSVIYL